MTFSILLEYFLIKSSPQMLWSVNYHVWAQITQFLSAFLLWLVNDNVPWLIIECFFVFWLVSTCFFVLIGQYLFLCSDWSLTIYFDWLIAVSFTDQARPDQVQTFLTESCLFRGLTHQNLNTLIAACLDNEKQPMVIYPYANEGNLKKFLQKCRMSDTGAHQVRYFFKMFRKNEV